MVIVVDGQKQWWREVELNRENEIVVVDEMKEDWSCWATE